MPGRRTSRVLRHLAVAVGYGLLGCVVAGVFIYVKAGLAKPALRGWHTLELEEEFRARRDAGLDLAGYLALEARLGAELDRRLAEVEDLDGLPGWSRFRPGRALEWNRTLERATPGARRGALLLHGSSDSPYSMRATAELLEAEGYHVLVMRYPGHGTIPAGLLSLRWQDLAAVVRIGARHLRDTLGPDAPLLIAGYSTGATLAVEYCAARVLGEELPAVERLVLLSPAIAVTGMAALASYQERLSGLAGLDELAWTDVSPEYDRYKYNSFTVNAGDLVYQLAGRVQEQLAQLAGADGRVHDFPATLAFVSAVDATVLAPAAVDAFLARLAPNGHELVLFDIDRKSFTDGLVRPGEGELATRLEATPDLPFALTVVTNAAPHSDLVVARTRAAGARDATTVELGLEWPPGVFSLAHVALPFPPDDRNYGVAPGGDPEAFSLGKLEGRGERGLLIVPSAELQRLRYNPFWDYLAARVVEFAGDP